MGKWGNILVTPFQRESSPQTAVAHLVSGKYNYNKFETMIVWQRIVENKSLDVVVLLMKNS